MRDKHALNAVQLLKFLVAKWPYQQPYNLFAFVMEEDVQFHTIISALSENNAFYAMFGVIFKSTPWYN